jgi:hypothetical protein
MNFRIALFLVLLIAFSTTVLAGIPMDVQVLRDGVPSGYISGRSLDIVIIFDSPVSAQNVEFTLYAEGMEGTINPTRCIGNNCYVENLNLQHPMDYEIMVKHHTNVRYFIISIDAGRPRIEGLRLFQRGGNWMIGASLFDPISDESEYHGSGIVLVEVVMNGGVVDSVQLDRVPDYEYDKPATFEVAGSSVEFSLRVHDAAGNVGTARFNRNIDSSPPVIASVNEGSSIWYADSQGRIMVQVVVSEDDRVDTQNSYVSIGLQRTAFQSCSFVSPNYVCTARIPIQPELFGTPQSAVIIVRDRFGNEARHESSPVIMADTQRPRLLRVWSHAVSYDDYSPMAFLSGSEFFAEFEHAPSGMDSSSTVARLIIPNNMEISADRCIMSGDVARCYFNVPMQGQAVTARISRGHDNAGNAMIASSEEVHFHIDSAAPSIIVGIGPSHDSLSTDTVVTIPESSSAYTRIIATKDEGSMINRIDIRKYKLSNNEMISEYEHGTSGCRNIMDQFVCDIPPLSAEDDFRLEIRVFDGSGNSASFTRTVRTGGSIIGGENWRVSSQAINPRFYFPGIPSQFVVTANILPSDNFFGSELGSARISGCTSSTGSIQNAMAFAHGNELRLTGTLTTAETNRAVIHIKCEVHVYAKRNRLISADHDVIVILVELHPYSSGADVNNPGERSASHSYFDGLSSPTAISILGTAEKIVDTGEAVCTAYTMLTSSSALLDAISSLTGGIISPVEPTARTLDEATEKIEKSFAEKACGFVTCETPGAKKVLDFYNNLESPLVDFDKDENVEASSGTDRGIANKPDESEMEKDENMTHSGNRRVQDSFVQSVISGCVPGIVKNIRKMQQVECGYAVCLLDAEAGQFPASMCDYARSTAQCEVFGSELFVAMPYGVIVKDFSININSLLSRPVTIGGGFIMNMVTKNSPELRSILKFAKFADVLLPMIGIDISTTPSPPAVDYCDILENRRAD